MAKRVWVYMSKSDPDQVSLTIGEQVDARARADAQLGVVNWIEHDLTAQARPAVAELVNAARERVATRDGTGRWRWRTIADVVKAWLGEPTDETCESCGQRWPTG